MKNTLKSCIIYSVVSAALFLGGSAQAVIEFWTNAPVDQTWTNNLNWDGGLSPGSVNATANTGNNVNGDYAIFNQPIPATGIGGPNHPIIIADSTNATRSLSVGGIIFDTASCGAYVFQTNLPCDWTFVPGGTTGSNGCFYVCERGDKNGTNGIVMTATVTTSQTFLVPLFTQLPSSTQGQYNFVNNAASAAATMYIYAVTNDSATSRGTFFTLDGSNTGTNTIEYLSKGPSLKASAQGFTKQGTGTWILAMPGGSDFTNSSVNSINDGKLVVLDPGCWGVSSSVIINSNGVEALQNVGQTNTTINGNGTILISGAGTIDSVAVGTAVGTTPHLNTTISSDVLSVAGGIAAEATAVSGGSATAVIHIGGPGTVLVVTNSTYLGNWSADTGVFQIGATSALGTGPSLNIAAGAIVDLTPLGAGVTFNPTTTGISASGTGTTVGTTAATIKPDNAGALDLATGSKNINLTYNPTSFTGDTTHPALYVSQGALNLGGNTITVNNATATPLGTGTYVLIQVASGTINNAGNLAANVVGSGVASGDVGTVSVSGGQVDLVVQPYVPKHLVWQGGNPNENWDVNTTLNWLNGGVSSVFNNSDFVTFNAVGAANPIVNLVGSLIPSQPVLVDTTAANYQFTGSGAIGGTASLTKMGTGTLIISNLNNYIGSTIVSNGTVQLGTNNALSDNSDITISNIATVDLNSWSAAIGALNGNGTVDTVAGGTPTLTIGANGDSGTFSGTLKNTAGSLILVKANTGKETLAGANTYSGTTTVSAGTLRVANPNALGSGASAVTLNSGTTLDISTNVNVASITGVGTVENDSTTTTNQLNFIGSSTITGVIQDGLGGGRMSVLVSGGTLEFNTVSPYSGGTIVASGAILELNDVSPGPEAGTGGIIASNSAIISMPGATSSSATFNNPLLTVDHATVTFTSGETANAFGDQFFGGITATDVFVGGNMSISGTLPFTNFLGTVIITNGSVRGFNATQGGPNTTFNLVGLGAYVVRDGGDVVYFGSLWGDPTAAITGATPNGNNLTTDANYIIGSANQSSVYSGTITGTNSVFKVGTGTLTLNGGGFLFTNIFISGLANVTNISYGSNQMTYVGTTTISNGVLALVAPTLLTNSSPIILAGATVASAVLDASSMGYITNFYDSDAVTITNSYPVTNSIFELINNPLTGPQTMGGVGTLKGNLIADQGTFLTPGLPTGVFNVTTNAALSGAVTMDLDDTNVATNSEFTALSFTVNSTATLVVTNIGPGLINGSTFTLFNHGVSFTSVSLPAKDPTGGTNYVWANNLTTSGTITLTSGGVQPPPATAPPITFSTSGNGSTLTLSWPQAYLGYILQVQTNPLSIGFSTNWVNVPNSSTVISTNITVNPQNPSVFYRLIQ